MSPANIEGVIAVGATGPDDMKSPYTTWGKALSISAPGGDKRKENGGIIQNTISTDGEDYIELQGTSMAAPHVSATIALLMSAGVGNPTLIQKTIFETADDLGKKGWDTQYGHGRINAGAAMTDLNMKRIYQFTIAASLTGGLAFISGIPYALLAIATSGFLAGGFFFLPWIQMTESTLWIPLLNHFNEPSWLNILLHSALLPCLTFLSAILRFRWLDLASASPGVCNCRLPRHHVPSQF